ncbi:MAG: Na+/H+ antiporter NhaC family protein [Victivallales bacterium]|nr:Na+/H+ antiporter NhaC family protein [Victivallales bacterium]
MSTDTQDSSSVPRPSCLALLPFFVFLVFYLGISICAGDFYKVPMPIAFLVATMVALFQNRSRKLDEKVELFAKSMGETNIMIMCLIFILSGIFAALAKGTGAVDAAVAVSRALIPDRLILGGTFIVSCLISLAIGTSCGTIAGLTPIAVGLVDQLGINPALLIGCVIGGAMFGDNMSIISDTTIAATRTQGVEMRDKFLSNLRFALPTALVTLACYLCQGGTPGAMAPTQVTWRQVILLIPYALVLAGALAGMNVMLLLIFGCLVATGIGLGMGAFDLWSGFSLMSEGMSGMCETIIVALLAGGLLGLIRYAGGISFLIQKIEKGIRSSRAAEFGVALLVGFVNLFTANNTVAIVVAGPIAAEISRKFHCQPKRIASILDTASCVIQGIIPYGAQILIASGIAKTAGLKVTALELLVHLRYPQFLALALILYIAFGAKKTAK